MPDAIALWASLCRMFVQLRRSPGIFYYVLAKLWLLVATPVTILLVTTHLSPEGQGYWYTILSLLAFQELAAFGFNNVLTQFVSHEWAYLHLEQGAVVGAIASRQRLASIVRLTLLWAGFVTVAATLIVGIGGYFYLNSGKPASPLGWQWPWAGIVGGLSLAMIGTILRSLSEGRHRVDLSQRAMLVGSLVGNLSGWIVLIEGGGLYGLATQQAVQGLIITLLLLHQNFPLLKLMRLESGTNRISWRYEFWRQQSRIGVSWAAGVLTFQITTPLLFHFQGPVIAGQFGLCMQANTFIMLTAGAWVTNAQPHFGAHWAQNEIEKLRKLKKSIYEHSLMTAIAVAVPAFAVIWLLKIEIPRYGARFSSLFVVAALFLEVVLKQRMVVETALVRFNKEEPFLLPSVVAAVSMVVFGVPAAMLSAEALAFIYLLNSAGLLRSWIHYIFQRYPSLAIRR